MKVRIWNAYASNNSGSYTIVGQLPSQAVAEAVAAELTTLIAAHGKWLGDPESQSTESPLAAFCRDNALFWEDGLGSGEDWSDSDDPPRVVAAGRQVIVHHHYTVSLPPTFGELFYRRGGRVQTEENHAHAPIVVTAEFRWGWREADKARQQLELPRLIAALTAADGPLSQQFTDGWPAAWRTAGTDWQDAPFTVGAVFKDLVASVGAVRDIATACGAQLMLRLHEADDETSDPLARLRPSTPAVARFELILTAASDPDAAADCIAERLHLDWQVAHDLVAALPRTIARGLADADAESTAQALRAVGATVHVARRDG